MGYHLPSLDQVSRLTLGQIWAAIYNPPTPLNLALGAMVIALMLPQWLKRWRVWTLGRQAVDFTWLEPAEADLAWTGRVIENPTLHSHLQDSTLQGRHTGKDTKTSLLTCYDPSTAYHLTTLALASASEIEAQISAAHSAQPAWRATSFAQRKRFLNSLRAWVVRDMDIICRVACRETGKTRVDAVFGEILTTLEKIDWLLKYGEKTLAPQRRASPTLLLHKVSTVHYEPLGTVAALVSWNYSFHNLLSPLLAALFAGNTIVLKCSEQVAWSSIWYINGVKACLRACGLDEDVVQLVVCLPENAEVVTRSPLISHVTFIGSEVVGRKVAAAAADIMVPTCIELGGKDPAFLLPSADIDFFASTFLRGVFQSSGQNCIGIELIVLPRALLPKFLSLVEPKIRALRPGTDVGSLISHAPISRLETIISTAAAAGATVLVGGKQYHHPSHPQAAYFEPTLIVDVSMDMDIAKEELFAPVMSVVCYDTVDEAVEWLNKSRFGLGAGVYGNNQRECEAVAAKLQCGMVAINEGNCPMGTNVCQGVFYLNQAMPFGGVKASGHGRFGGEEGLRSLCSTKSIIHDRFFSLIRTPIPRPVDFPLPKEDVYWPFLLGLVWTVYGGVTQRGRGLKALIGAAVRA